MNCLGWSAHCPKCGWSGMLRHRETKEEHEDAKLEWDLHACVEATGGSLSDTLASPPSGTREGE